MLIAIAHDDAYVLGVLSSRIHALWALAQGGRLGVGNDPRYNKTRCFNTFPFPEATPDQKAAIREKAETLDKHRKRQLGLHADLTLTELYNVLEKLRSGEELTDKEKDISERGLVSTLNDYHAELDALVAEAYGWPADLDEQTILGHLTVLNAERAAEERQDRVRYLRPEYQNPNANVQEFLVEAGAEVAAEAKRPTFPRKLAEQSRAIRQALREAARPMDAQQVARIFRGAKADRVEEVLEMLVDLGQVREVAEYGGYTA